MNKILFALTSAVVIAAATSAAAANTGFGCCRNGVAQTGLVSERLGGSTKGTGGLNGVSQSGLSAAARPAQASMTVLSVTLPAKAGAVGARR